MRLTIGIIVVLAIGITTAVLVGGNDDTTTNQSATTNQGTTSVTNLAPGAQSAAEDPQLLKLDPGTTATVETSKGTFTMKFYLKDAPELTKNFIELAKRGYYDGVTFHRIVPGFVIQGGDPLGTGTGGESYSGQGLADEQGALALKHLRGAVAWAKSSLPNSIGSQFYVVLDEPRTASLNGSYSVFGHVISGMDVVDDIAAVGTDANDKPLEPVTITKVTIEE
jgi:peptidyl-prolyl cis-trans isomerase B (cyclophilin B)